MGHRHVLALLLVVGCADLKLDDRPPIIHARFDPDAKSIPMPTDVLRDATCGKLDLPNDTPEDLARSSPPAEPEFYAYLETLDGWSSLMSATVDLTGRDRSDDRSTTTTLAGLALGAAARRASPTSGSRSPPTASTLTIDPPRDRLAARRALRRGAARRRARRERHSRRARRVRCGVLLPAPDRARSTRRSTSTRSPATPTPSATRTRRSSRRSARTSRRRSTSSRRSSLPRAEVAALWAFTVTTRTELAMDQPSQRMPLPIDLMIDPTTGHVDAPARAVGSRRSRPRPRRGCASSMGFGLSRQPAVRAHRADRSDDDLRDDSVQLYQLGGGAPVPVPATVELLADQLHLVVTPKAGRLAEQTRYRVVVDDRVRDAGGQPPTLMPIGHFLQVALAGRSIDGTSQVAGRRRRRRGQARDGTRASSSTALDALGRDHVLAAWPFTTMTVSRRRSRSSARAAERLAGRPIPRTSSST